MSSRVTFLTPLALLAVAVAGGAAEKAAPSPAPAQAKVSVSLANDSGRTIREAYVSATGDPGWGHNLLRGELAPGKRTGLDVAQGCRKYDVRLVAEGGTEFLDEEVELCGQGQTLRVGNAALSLTGGR